MIAGWGSGNVSVYFNTVSGFVLQNNYATGTNPREISVADFNGDGAADIAVLNNGSANVMTLLNTGAGAFAQEGAPTAVGTNPFSLTSGDFDGDGRPDLAVSNTGDDTVSILIRSPARRFTSAGTVAVGDQPINMSPGDFDGNGTLDLAVAVAGGSLDVIRRGASGPVRDTSTPLPGSPYGVAVADFNADGRTDVAVTSLTVNQMSVLLSPSPATQPPPQPTPTPTPPATLDNPQVNREVNVLPVSGTVRIKRRGSNRYVDLKAGEQIPNGSSIDARKGRVTIVAAQSATKTRARRLLRRPVHRDPVTQADDRHPERAAQLPARQGERGAEEAQVAQAVGRRQGQVPHQGPLRGRDRARHAVAGPATPARRPRSRCARVRSACATTSASAR